MFATFTTATSAYVAPESGRVKFLLLSQNRASGFTTTNAPPYLPSSSRHPRALRLDLFAELFECAHTHTLSSLSLPLVSFSDRLFRPIYSVKESHYLHSQSLIPAPFSDRFTLPTSHLPRIAQSLIHALQPIFDQFTLRKSLNCPHS